MCYKNKYLYSILCITSMSLTYSSRYLLNTNELLVNFYSDQLAQEQVKPLLTSQQKWTWLGYAIINFNQK